MARGVGRPPKQVLSRNSSQEISDGENSGGSNGENSGINLLDPSSILASPAPFKHSTSSSSHNSNYVAPQWLLEKKTAKFFSVPIPGVSQEVQDALEQKLSESGDLAHKLQARKSHKLLAQIKHLQDQLAKIKQEKKEQEQMLAKAISTKEKKLAAMRKQKKHEMEVKLQKLEDKMQLEKEAKLKEAEEATRKKIEEEFEVAFEKEEESRKRKRKEEEEAKEAAAKEADDTKSEDKPDEKSSEGGSSETDKDKKDDDAPETEKKKLKSELIQEKIDAANAKTESLTETKSEMVWLMKQVIKAEMKRKLMDPRKKESS